MSELDVREVKLQLRYPESRQEDITDAYMRGYKSAVQVTDKLITRLNEENEKLREFASESFSMAFNFYHGAGTAEDLRELEVEYRELGTEVDG